MNFRSVTSYFTVGFILTVVGVGLVLYGSLIPNDITIHPAEWDYSIISTINIFIIIGFIILFIGVGLLAFWALTRHNSKIVQVEKKPKLSPRTLVFVVLTEVIVLLIAPFAYYALFMSNSYMSSNGREIALTNG